MKQIQKGSGKKFQGKYSRKNENFSILKESVTLPFARLQLLLFVSSFASRRRKGVGREERWNQYLTLRKKKTEDVSIAFYTEPASKILKLVAKNSILQRNFNLENSSNIGGSQHCCDVPLLFSRHRVVLRLENFGQLKWQDFLYWVVTQIGLVTFNIFLFITKYRITFNKVHVISDYKWISVTDSYKHLQSIINKYLEMAHIYICNRTYLCSNQ